MILGVTVIVLISFRSAFAGLLKDHAMTVTYALTTRTPSRSSYNTSVDSTSESARSVDPNDGDRLVRLVAVLVRAQAVVCHGVARTE